jgi:hypothetical protein
MDGYRRPPRLLAALAVGAAVAAGLIPGRRGRAAAVTLAGALVGRQLAGVLAPAAGRTRAAAGAAHRPRPPEDGPDELRRWVAAGHLPAPVRPDGLSS